MNDPKISVPPEGKIGAHSVLVCMHRRFSEAFRSELIAIVRCLLDCDLQKAEIVYSAPESSAARLRLVSDLIKHELSGYREEKLLQDCLTELGLIDRWADVELNNPEALQKTSSEKFLWQVQRCRALLQMLHRMLGEPDTGNKPPPPDDDGFRAWQALVFETPFNYDDILH